MFDVCCDCLVFGVWLSEFDVEFYAWIGCLLVGVFLLFDFCCCSLWLWFVVCSLLLCVFVVCCLCLVFGG